MLLRFLFALLSISLILREIDSATVVTIRSVRPNVSPIKGGIETFITGVGFTSEVKAEFSVKVNSPLPAHSFTTNSDGTATASFITPGASQSQAAYSSWVRLVSNNTVSGAVAFYWEDPITISSVATSITGSRTLYAVTGSGFYHGIYCTSPIHSPVPATVKSANQLECLLSNTQGPISELVLIQKSGATTSYRFTPTSSTTGGGSGTTSGSTTGGSLPTLFGSATLVYAWAGAVDRVNPDYIVIIDAVPGSPTYKKVIGKAELPAELAVGNEPHHMQFVNNNTVVVAGGLLSVLRRPQELFFWNVSNPINPTFMKAENPPTSSVVDDILALPQGGFLVSIMGAADGSSPGAIGEWDANLQFVGEWPPVGERPPDFNPHGVSLNPQLDILITSDFIDPASSLHPSSTIKLRDTIRIFKPWSNRRVTATVKIPEGIGLMDVKFLPNNPDGIAYTTNFGSQGMVVWAINSTSATATPAFNVSGVYNCSQRDHMLHQPVPSGNRHLVTNSYSGLVIYFDTTNPMKLELLDSVVYGVQSGIHAIEISDDGKFVMVSGYFLNEDDMGLVHEDGDRAIHIAEIRPSSLVQTDFNVNLNTAVPYPMRPHMIRFFNTATTTRPL